jgi:hypothetical protein
MTKIIITKVYTLDELKGSAKEKARDWFKRDGLGLDYEWWHDTYTEAGYIGLEIDSFDLYKMAISGELHSDAVDVAKQIIKKHSVKCDTYKLAVDFITCATAKRILLGADYKENEMYKSLSSTFETNLLTAYLTILGDEYHHLNSNAAIDKTILSNEYTFTEEGARFG